MAMETMMEAVDRLHKKGYVGQCRAEPDGIRFLEDGSIYPPERVVVEDVVRLEGTSSPDEEDVIFAISSPKGHKATYCLTYSSTMDPLDSDMMQRLDLKPDKSASECRDPLPNELY